ncbi:DNA ligase D [Caulobacter segnis]|uniref:DNA ligase D n=1 Tax=Caulobacter segnis TaxID=88688 RepID=UPI0024105FCD|nr:DNA ligase D [Caulobacter segnis]MDG2522224.1 DNA ligase D [Caulobacter segnis]
MASAKLSTYRAKRDFTKTAEPSGKGAVEASERLRFVIQKHAATRLHYDLRLEHKGVFLSWAVTRGPSLDPADKRLAVEVEPHPLDYGDFEGAIPKGQYGGGTVMLWDRGYWFPPPGEDVDAMLKKGDLKVVFAGERMQGEWVLVRMKHDRNGGKRTNWLLIKHRDGYEHEDDDDALLNDNAFSIASGRKMEEIAEGKGKAPTPFMTDQKRSAGSVWKSNRDPEASAEKAARKADAPKAKASQRPKKPAKAARLPDFIEPQFCKLVDRPPVGDGWGHEIKFDGYRMQLRVHDGAAALRTRKGLDWSDSFPAIVEDAADALPDCMIDGEVVALDENGSPDFAGLQAALSDGRTDDLIYYVFDLLFADGEDLRPLPLSERKTRLKALLEKAKPGDGRIRYVDHFATGGDAVLQSACRMSLEGIVSKKLDAPYRSGRGGDWTKSKCRAGHEVVIGGYTTTGSAFRSLIAGVNRNGKLVHVGRIGTGYGKEKLADLVPKLKALETDKSPFEGAGAPRKAANVRWVKPQLVAEIEYAGFTGDGALRQASFKGLRADKPAREVQSEAPVPVEEAELAQPAPAKSKAKARPAAKAPAADNHVLGITISSPDRIVWPDAGDGEPGTKLDNARYLEAVADWMMPHIKGRPCSVIRFPDGIGGEKFFQRHVGKGMSSLIAAKEVSGDRQPYIQIDRKEAIIALAQFGSIEFHPWNCQPDDVEHAGRLVFDLDPSEELGFDVVIQGAREIRDRLEELGLVSFCKTTGGKGLHVVTPLTAGKAAVPWDEAKAFAREVCDRMAADSPDRYVVNMAKKVRKGRIFLDYLRNDRMSTAVAPLSPRGRPGAPVSMPLNWTQVRTGLDPKRFNIRTVPDLLARSTAWADYDDAARSLAAAIKRLK